MFSTLELTNLFGKPEAPDSKHGICSGVSIDTRSIEAGHLFFAISGPRFDGHDFIQEALARNAYGVVVAEEKWEASRPRGVRNVFRVRNTTEALGKLASQYRANRKFKTLAVTGSCGKTSTKQLAHYLLSLHGAVGSTLGNWNNQYGLPLSLLAERRPLDLFLAEIAASQRGDIAYLCKILDPDLGLITNVYPAHLAGIGTLEDVYRTKLELAASLEKKKGTLLVWGDDSRLVELAQQYDVILKTFGSRPDADYRMSGLREEDDFFSFTLNDKYHFQIRAGAGFTVDNYLAAMALAHEAGIPLEDMPERLDKVPAPAGRFQFCRLGKGITVINDAYNANPGSMKKALEAFSHSRKWANRKIAVLGEMRELGEQSLALHREIGAGFAEWNIDSLFTVGDEALPIHEAAQETGKVRNCQHFNTNEELGDNLLAFLRSGDTVLIKGSRRVRLEEVFEMLRSTAPRDEELLRGF